MRVAVLGDPGIDLEIARIANDPVWMLRDREASKAAGRRAQPATARKYSPGKTKSRSFHIRVHGLAILTPSASSRWSGQTGGRRGQAGRIQPSDRPRWADGGGSRRKNETPGLAGGSTTLFEWGA